MRALAGETTPNPCVWACAGLRSRSNLARGTLAHLLLHAWAAGRVVGRASHAQRVRAEKRAGAPSPNGPATKKKKKKKPFLRLSCCDRRAHLSTLWSSARTGVYSTDRKFFLSVRACTEACFSLAARREEKARPSFSNLPPLSHHPSRSLLFSPGHRRLHCHLVRPLPHDRPLL